MMYQNMPALLGPMRVPAQAGRRGSSMILTMTPGQCWDGRRPRRRTTQCCPTCCSRKACSWCFAFYAVAVSRSAGVSRSMSIPRRASSREKMKQANTKHEPDRRHSEAGGGTRRWTIRQVKQAKLAVEPLIQAYQSSIEASSYLLRCSLARAVYLQEG